MNRQRHPFPCALAAFVALIATTATIAPRAARADESMLEARANEALRLYRGGEYEQAAEKFAALSVDYPEHLVFLHNLGACHYYLRRPEQAISNLSSYLGRAKDVDSHDRARIEGWIAEMKQLQAQREAAALSAARSPPAPTPTPQRTPAPDPAPSPTTTQAAANTVTTRSHTMPVLLTVVGGVAIAGGVVATLFARDKFAEVEDQYDPDVEASGKTFAALQFVGYGLGAAALATAVVLWTRGEATETKQARLHLAPVVGRVNGASLRLRF